MQNNSAEMYSSISFCLVMFRIKEAPNKSKLYVELIYDIQKVDNGHQSDICGIIEQIIMT